MGASSILNFQGAMKKWVQFLEVLIIGEYTYINSKTDVKNLERKGFPEDEVIGLLVIWISRSTVEESG
jgi:hypothetical protein